MKTCLIPTTTPIHLDKALRIVVALFLLLAGGGTSLGAQPERLRIVAANISSGNYQTYAPTNGNYSNVEGAGARILTALEPDLVLIQEFTTTIPTRQWVNATLGPEFSFFTEPLPADTKNAIPNGIISRHPIEASGQWQDPVMINRHFAWSRIVLPGGQRLWAISVHFYSKKAGVRTEEAEALLKAIQETVPAGDLIVLGGDLNTRNREEACLDVLSVLFNTKGDWPADPFGNANTNSPRNRPYDWVLVCRPLEEMEVPVELDGVEYPHGLVFDTRVHPRMENLPPAQAGDSAVPQMQHMAVVRDFLLPIRQGIEELKK